jgi:hypothetical protein
MTVGANHPICGTVITMCATTRSLIHACPMLARSAPRSKAASFDTQTLASLPSGRAARAVEDTITSNALDLVAQCDRVVAAKGGLLSEVR